MTNTVTYTRVITAGGSSLVDETYYNDNDKTLYVDLNDRVYAYKNVPESVVDALSKTNSIGSFYGTDIKRAYGPGEFVGIAGEDVDYDYVDVDEAPAAMPKDLTYAANAVVDGKAINAIDHPEYFSLSVPSAPVFDGLDYMDDADYDEVPDSPTAQYRVEFILDGLVRKTVINASSFGHAVTEVRDAANVVGLEADVRSVSLV